MSTAIPEDFLGLLDDPTAILATISPSGAPQVTAVWFLYDVIDGTVKISLNDTRQKVKNLRANPKATVFLLDPKRDTRTLELRGTVEVLPDTDYAFALGPVRQKYGADVRAYDPPGSSRLVAVLKIDKVVPTDMG